MGRLDGSTALALSMHSHQVMVAEWKRRVQGAPTEGSLKAVAQGLRILSSGGSDWLAGSGRAEKVEGGYRIHARKVFSSGSPDGGMMNTCAIFDDPQAGPTVLHFPLPMKDAAVKVASNWDTLGMRGSGSHDVEIRRRASYFDFPARGIIRGRWEIDDYDLNVGIPPEVLAGPAIGGLTRPQPGDSGWDQPLSKAIAGVAAKVMAPVAGPSSRSPTVAPASRAMSAPAA